MKLEGGRHKNTKDKSSKENPVRDKQRTKKRAE